LDDNADVRRPATNIDAVKIDITPLILTFNEKENIGRTLSAIRWIDKVVIVDSFSSDETLKLAQDSHRNVRILQREFDTHATQWNFGLGQIDTEWVLTLDADYEVSADLADEIKQLSPPEGVVGYQAVFEYRIFGRSVRASVYPPRIVLFRAKHCSYYDDGHTQRLRANGTVRSLRGKIYHDDRKPFSHWLQSQNKYAKIEAKHLLAQPLEKLSAPDRLRRKLFFAAPAMFFYLLFARGLILDGWPGWVYVCQRTVAEFLLSKALIVEKFGNRS
jgi:glycosyltransferase involved in cell wall biosynthesis